MLSRMTASLNHRGPDGTGTWLGLNGTVGLGQTRLAIIDLESGKQPMFSADGRYVIVFNGEIYNFQQLRNELRQKGQPFQTNSDTEVIMEAFRVWGKDCLKRFHGMFAFAVFDIITQQLFLARDQVGIKPVYYAHTADGFFFGSELKAILTVPNFPRRLNHKAVADFFVLGYPLMPHTFFGDICELEPGTWIHVAPSGTTRGRNWAWKRQETDWNEAEALDRAEEALLQSLRDHLVSDVPVGAFLSGGIDSSLLVALLSVRLGIKLDTFTVKLGETTYDESPYAKAVASYLGTHHHEIVINKDGVDFALVERILDQFDQPFGDSSAIPTYLISREIRQHVKVAIGGDGGDEMFGGYPRFRNADVAQFIGYMPGWLLKAGYRGLQFSLGSAFPEIVRQAGRAFRGAYTQGGERLLAMSCYVYPDQLSEVLHPDLLDVLDGYRPSFSVPESAGNSFGGRELIDATIAYALPGDYLRKVDVMSGAHGLEVRVPFLGAQVLDYASQLPHSLR
ncbi:MAG: asparagine synthase (glutamine-hydrolyzing), partial [Pseudomonadota bacterium]